MKVSEVFTSKTQQMAKKQHASRNPRMHHQSTTTMIHQQGYTPNGHNNNVLQSNRNTSISNNGTKQHQVEQFLPRKNNKEMGKSTAPTLHENQISKHRHATMGHINNFNHVTRLPPTLGR
jgi:hypothetical protein